MIAEGYVKSLTDRVTLLTLQAEQASDEIIMSSMLKVLQSDHKDFIGISVLYEVDGEIGQKVWVPSTKKEIYDNLNL